MSTDIIVLTGPESSGKTTLAGQLSAHWRAPLAGEVVRDYLKDAADYKQSDLVEIAKRQLQEENKLLSLSPERIVCDTDLLVIMIWSEVKYGECDPWIYTTFEHCITLDNTNRYYLLCDPSIPWQADPLRENPHNRDELFDLYLQKLREYGLNYEIATGDPEDRLQQVIASTSVR